MGSGRLWGFGGVGGVAGVGGWGGGLVVFLGVWWG